MNVRNALCGPDNAIFLVRCCLSKRLVKDRLLPEPKLMKTSLRICLAGLMLRISWHCFFILAANFGTPLYEPWCLAAKKVPVNTGSHVAYWCRLELSPRKNARGTNVHIITLAPGVVQTILLLNLHSFTIWASFWLRQTAVVDPKAWLPVKQ